MDDNDEQQDVERARGRALADGAEVFRCFFADHAGEFAEAFPDDEPGARGT